MMVKFYPINSIYELIDYKGNTETLGRIYPLVKVKDGLYTFSLYFLIRH